VCVCVREGRVTNADKFVHPTSGLLIMLTGDGP